MLSYDQISLIPKKCIVKSRSECDISIKIGQRTFCMPVMPANMPACISHETCEFLAKNNVFYCYHRFGLSPLEFSQFCSSKNIPCSISIGVNNNSYNDLAEYYNSTVHKAPLEYIMIDIAHAHSNTVKEMAQYLKKTFPKTTILAGNVATEEAIIDLVSWGIDWIKVSVGPGKACSTKSVSGFHVSAPMLLFNIKNPEKYNIIMDGGIEEIGDLNKALVFGGKMVCCGWLFSGYDQSAKVDHYYGNASEFINGKSNRIEGHSIPINSRGDMNILLTNIKEGIQSGVSYAGGRDLSGFRNVDYYIGKTKYARNH